MIQICEWEEIAKNFDSACEEAKLKDKDIASSVGCHGSAVGRARDGSQEPGIERFTRFCVAVGKTPNQLVFREALPQALPVLNLNQEDQSHLLRLARVFIKMNRLAPEAVSMAAVFAAEAEAALKTTEEFLARRAESALPVGSVVTQTGVGERTLNAPPKSERTRKGDTGKNRKLAN